MSTRLVAIASLSQLNQATISSNAPILGESAMPCPYFEPLQTVVSVDLRNARLPLIEEHAGRCLHHGGQAGSYACNHGYARGVCEHFPPNHQNAANRFSLVSSNPEDVELLFIREEAYAPVATRLLHFSVSADRLLEGDLDSCVHAQATAFCRSYLKTHRSPAH
jgi:hypothetical protein